MLLMACGPLDLGSQAPAQEAPPIAYDQLPFATEVVGFESGTGGGFGADRLPDVVLGPPQGAGESAGSTHVLSLGVGGEIILSFAPRHCVDGDGADFMVFENAFRSAGAEGTLFVELGEVSVSEDGENWQTFPCDSNPDDSGSYPGCAGWNPVLAKGLEETVPLDPERSGGDAFDLAELGLTQIQFVKIRDLSEEGLAPSAGFDLDALGLVNFR